MISGALAGGIGLRFNNNTADTNDTSWKIRIQRSESHEELYGQLQIYNSESPCNTIHHYGNVVEVA